MFETLLKVNYFQSFYVNGIKCEPFKINNNYYLPLGWEEILDNSGIKYTIVEVEIKEDNE